MRKGFTLTLTALASVLLVSSALALGPTIKNVPDVYIGPAAATGAPVEPGVNTFRYTDALVLWDYVTPGATSGTGSSSDTLFWTWAAKNATLAGPTGSFLDPSLPATDPNGIHYSIEQKDGRVVSPIRSTNTEGSAAWKADINGTTGLTNQSLVAAGALTFRNIRLSPLPPIHAYPAPTAMPVTLPAGYLDIQSASLYATDGTTTPGVTHNLLVTVDAGPDFLSGGAVWELVNDVTNVSSWLTSTQKSPPNNYEFNVSHSTIPAPTGECSVSNTGTSIAVTTVQNNPTFDATHDSFYFTSVAQLASVVLGQANPLAPGNVYRMKAMVASSNANTANNPSVLVGFNGRTTGGGWGAPLFNKQTSWGPTTTTGPIELDGYVIPAVQSDSILLVADYDEPLVSPASVGGTITFSGIKIFRFPLANLSGAVEKLNKTTFAPADYSYIDAPYGAFNTGNTVLPTFSHTPTSGSGPMVLTGNANNSGTNRGFASMDLTAHFTPTAANKLIVCKAMVTGAGSGTFPTLWLNVTPLDSSYQGIYLLDPANGSGPNATAKAFYTVLNVPSALAAAQWGFSFRIVVDGNAVNGSYTVQSLVITEYDNPAEP